MVCDLPLSPLSPLLFTRAHTEILLGGTHGGSLRSVHPLEALKLSSNNASDCLEVLKTLVDALPPIMRTDIIPVAVDVQMYDHLEKELYATRHGQTTGSTDLSRVLLMNDMWHVYKEYALVVWRVYHQPFIVELCHAFMPPSSNDVFPKPSLQQAVHAFAMMNAAYNRQLPDGTHHTTVRSWLIDRMGELQQQGKGVYLHGSVLFFLAHLCARAADVYMHALYALFEQHIPLVLNFWQPFSANTGQDVDAAGFEPTGADELLARLPFIAAFFRLHDVHVYVRTVLLTVSRLLHLREKHRKLYNLYSVNMFDFLTEDLEVFHSQLSRLLSRMNDRASNDSVVACFHTLPAAQATSDNFTRDYNCSEHAKNKRRLEKEVDKDMEEVVALQAYLADLLRQLSILGTDSVGMVNVDKLSGVVPSKMANRTVTYEHELLRKPVACNLLRLTHEGFSDLRKAVWSVKRQVARKVGGVCRCAGDCGGPACGCMRAGRRCSDGCECADCACKNKE